VRDVHESGRDLARRYHDVVVGPLLAARWPSLSYAAGRLGSGSDVLGLDDARSTDHDWGLRLTLLVDESMVAEVDAHLEQQLPATFGGLPTRFGVTWDPSVRHRAEVSSPLALTTSRLGTPWRDPLPPTDWLDLTGQAVLEVTAGPVFVDTTGEITRIRSALAWYPDDVWLHVLAVGWARLGNELPLVGRAGQVGDDIGSRLVAARLVQTAMHLGFLLDRRWAPYGKWFGTLFRGLPRAGALAPVAARVLAADTWADRDAALAELVDGLHAIQVDIGLPTPGHAAEWFWDRPFHGIAPVDAALFAAVTDPEVRAIPRGRGAREQLEPAPGSIATV
jgi:hypothetical protein